MEQPKIECMRESFGSNVTRIGLLGECSFGFGQRGNPTFLGRMVGRSFIP
jgi:hypothetical protein